MSGLLFQDAPPAAPTSPHRADVVCFIGFVARRTGVAVPARLKTWLQDEGWRPRGTPVADSDELLHTPVPVESFEAFDRLFVSETRVPADDAPAGGTWLGAAVRLFFRQGGARCVIVRTGDPGPYRPVDSNTSLTELSLHRRSQRERLGVLLPGLPSTGTRPAERSVPDTWRGLGVLFGLGEVALVCLPALPELVADLTLAPRGLPPPPPGPETFVTCTPEIAAPVDPVRAISASPACSESGYMLWRQAARHVALFLRTHRRDLQAVLALPLPAPALERTWWRGLDQADHLLGLGAGQTLDAPAGIASAFLQLAFPWAATPDANALPGGLAPPDAILAGALARAIPLLGAGHSAGRQPLRGIQDFFPALPAECTRAAAHDRGAMLHRVSLLGPTADGPRVLSDVTTSDSPDHRPACVGRLTAALLRAASALGVALTFEPSGPALWERLGSQLERLLEDFYAAGALAGATAAEAYSVRCDTTTMTPQDQEQGRVLAEVRFRPAHPVGEILVRLALRDGTVSAVETPA